MQSTESQDAVRDPPLGKRVSEDRHMALGAEENRTRMRSAAAVRRLMLRTQPREESGALCSFVINRVRVHVPHVTGGGPRPGLEGRDVNAASAVVGNKRVGGIQNEGVIAPTGHECHVRAGAGAGEGCREGREVVCAGASPSIDRLMRVAYRHDRTVGEQLGQELGLLDRGVLIFIEQHHPVLTANLVGDRWCGRHDLERTRYLVCEVHGSLGSLCPRVVANELGKKRKRAHRGVELLDVAGGCQRRVAGRFDAAREAVAERRELVEVDAMVQDLAGEALQAVDDSSEPVLAVCEPRIARGDHDPPRKQPGC